MNTLPMDLNSRSGATLVVVMVLTLLGTLAASSVAFCTGSRVLQAHKQVCLEQAFYLASAGAERAASRVAAGDETSGTLTANLGQGSYVTAINSVPGAVGGEVNINVVSVGTVNNVSRTVTMKGLRRVSWARYALWYDTESTTLNMFPGERFDGRVYSKPKLHFSNTGLVTTPAPGNQVLFTDRVWSNASSYDLASSAVKPIFQQGIVLNAALETMASVNFSDLYTQASANGLVLQGPTTIVINNQTMTITNKRAYGSTTKTMTLPALSSSNKGMLIYVKTATSGTDTRTGDLTISAPNGLGNRLTVVADNDILIPNHLKYVTDPLVTPSSTDALGLIAKRDVSVQTSSPKDLNIYAHIICQTGGFGVINYTTRTGCGTLKLVGGIVNSIRRAVNQNGGGAAGGTGYTKNYIFDKRFTDDPPPYYPVLTEELEWTEWQG